jgi:hypothetical protein
MTSKSFSYCRRRVVEVSPVASLAARRLLTRIQMACVVPAPTGRLCPQSEAVRLRT